MNKRSFYILILLIFICIIFTGCAKMAIGPTSTEMSSESIQTAAAETMAALPAATEAAIQELKYKFFIPMASGNDNMSSQGSEGNSSATTPEMTATRTPTITRTPTSTPIPDTLTPTTAPCLQAEFLEHINVPPGSKFTGGSKFTKIWRVKNTGSCPWYSTYTMVLVSGDGMGGGSETTINAAVGPGQTVDLMIDLTAPKNNGRYKSAWMLYNLAGQVFGVGEGATGYLWADIKVVNAPTATSKSSSKATATTKPAATTAPSATSAPPTATTAPTSTFTPSPTYTETPTPTFTNTPD